MQHRGTLNSRRPASPLVSLLEEEERWESPDHLKGVLPQNWGGTELKRTVTCLRLTTCVHLALCRDEFRGSRSDIVKQVALVTITACSLEEGCKVSHWCKGDVWFFSSNERVSKLPNPLSMLLLNAKLVNN
ncbi:uncharacterized protein TNCV_3355231 [Trichonephila clavipes]|nr:uncharacterized protein TNCV_3355231 [Trichonephila clavipes]